MGFAERLFTLKICLQTFPCSHNVLKDFYECNLKYLLVPLWDALSDRSKKVWMVQIEQDAIGALEKGKSKRHSS
jgi:hypothetical protein